MPRFYLHVRNGIGFAPDDEGSDLADLAAARAVAIDGARSLLCDEVRQGRLDLRGRIEIADAGGRIVDVIRFRDAIEILDGELPPAGEPRPEQP